MIYISRYEIPRDTVTPKPAVTAGRTYTDAVRQRGVERLFSALLRADDKDGDDARQALRDCIALGRELSALESVLGISRSLNSLAAYPATALSACLALAQARQWLGASDECRTFLREAHSRLGEGRIPNTAGIHVLAIRAGLLTVEDADAAKAILEQRRLRLKFDSFRDVL